MDMFEETTGLEMIVTQTNLFSFSEIHCKNSIKSDTFFPETLYTGLYIHFYYYYTVYRVPGKKYPYPLLCPTL